MPDPGYYRFPAIYRDTVVFVSEDDLWSVPVAGGAARRLTASPAQETGPALSPDGSLLAFTSRDEGAPEIFVMPAEGGTPERLTYLGADTWVAGWHPSGGKILFASNAAQPIDRIYALYAIDAHGGQPELLPTGPAVSIAYGPPDTAGRRGLVIGRHATDLAGWKRYRGGLTGALWIDRTGAGEWRRLIELNGNEALPLWVGDRIFFLSDHEGTANLYSCLADGSALRRHTHHEQFYVRHPATDGRRIVYQCGADIYVYDPSDDTDRMVPIAYHSPRAQRARRFVDPGRYLQDYSLHPDGHSVAVVCRGKPYSLGNWEGAVIQHGQPQGVRYRLSQWLADGRRLVMVSDAAGEETVEVHQADGLAAPERLEGLEIGRADDLQPSPVADLVAISNHRHELIVVDLVARTARVLDRSPYERLSGMAWSPDGRWIAYGFPTGVQTSIIKLCNVETGEIWEATRPVLRDLAPSFDPDGKYLYFISYREFNPVHDSLHFDLNFPRGMRPYLVTLRSGLRSPFIPVPAPLHKADRDEHPEDTSQESGKGVGDEEPSGDSPLPDVPPIEIDLEGLPDRVLAFPVPEGRYGQVRGIRGKLLFSRYPVEGTLREPETDADESEARGKLECYDLEEREHDVLVEGIGEFGVSLDGSTMVYRAGDRLRVLEAGKKPPEDEDVDKPGRKSGWVDLERIKVLVEPPAEWAQMYREAWRLQRDQFWVADMAGVDWQAVYDRYLPLLARCGTRSEFSDLLREMQGELGTSHTYEMGGDYRPGPGYTQGFLGVDIARDPDTGSYTITHVVNGDVWDEEASSPLARPGMEAKPGDRILSINGLAVSPDVSPQQLLANLGGEEVLLVLQDPDDGERALTVRTLCGETPARYREWVEANRQWVHSATAGRLGYVHIPDMGERGYAEFHRGYLLEVDRQGLIVDLRYNAGGYVSQLLLEKLSRRRLGYDIHRWGEPIPYPVESVAGPLVAIANELSGSDGDMFAHAFKLMNLGPLVGKRTWGGVIGIEVRDTLVDSGVTTQPEFSTWFHDVGYGIENYGTRPDIEVEVRPQDYVARRDPQLERAVAEGLRLLAEKPPLVPGSARPGTVPD